MDAVEEGGKEGEKGEDGGVSLEWQRRRKAGEKEATTPTKRGQVMPPSPVSLTMKRWRTPSDLRQFRRENWSIMAQNPGAGRNILHGGADSP